MQNMQKFIKKVVQIDDGADMYRKINYFIFYGLSRYIVVTVCK